MSADHDVERAQTEAELAKQRLLGTVSALKAKLAPGALAHDAGEKIKGIGQGIVRSGTNAVRNNPLPAIGAIAMFGAFIARKPLLRLLRRNKSKT